MRGALVSGAIVYVLAGPAAAVENRFAIQQLALRAGVQALHSDVPRTGAATVGVSYWGRPGVSGEVTVGRGVGERSWNGLWGAATLRYGHVFGEAGAHAVGFGTGVSRWIRGPSGPLTFVRVEGFYELRLREGFDLLVTAGPAWAVTDASVGTDGAPAVQSGAHDLAASLALGWSF